MCHQRTPVSWWMPSWFITTNEERTTLKAGPVRFLSTLFAPFRNMEETAWWELPSPRSWLMKRELLMVRAESTSFFKISVRLRYCQVNSVCLFEIGVKVRKGQEEVEIHAPVVVSNCGIFNTFQKLLPPEIQAKPGEKLYWNWGKVGQSDKCRWSEDDTRW